MSGVPLQSTRWRDNGNQARASHLPGEAGLWVFIFGDMAVFALFFGMTLVLRREQPEMFAASQALLHPGYGLVNTVFLLTGSFLVVRAMQSLRPATEPVLQGRARYYLGGALLSGMLFAAVKATEYGLLLKTGQGPSSNDFFIDYFVFTGIHLAHLVLGMAGLVATILLSRQRPLSAGRFRAAECAACYWHLVDLLWLVLFPLLYLVH